MSENLLIIENISKSFTVDKNKELKALKNINIRLKKGECIGIVGESGCGKSTLARIIVGIEKKTSGKIIFDDKEVDGISKTKDIQMIFQSPLSSFNPRMKIIDYMWEPLRNYFKLSKKESIPLITKSLVDVGLDETALEKYPHEFSGGQLQRITIARAIIIKPKLIVCDEITTKAKHPYTNLLLNSVFEVNKV